MENDINLIDKSHNKTNHAKKSRAFIYPLAILGILFFIFLHNIIFSEDSIVKYFVKNIASLTTSANKDLLGEQEDRLNVLILGHGGYGHDGANLTDSIHVVSIKLSEGKAHITSVPRDLLVDIPDYGPKKINHAYALTEAEAPGSGGEVASKVVGDTLGIPIHYYITVNFEAFTTLIDDVNGIDVYIENGFVDHQYPDDNYEYQTVQFEKGWTALNGEEALKFARSRHGICTTACQYGEGSDFARAKRQQQMLTALKDKIFSIKTLANPKSVYKLFSNYQENVTTNIELWEMIKLYDVAKTIKNNEISHLVLDTRPESFLQDKILNTGAYVLVPKSGSFDEIQQLVTTIFDAPQIKVETPLTLVEIQNGTTITGYAAKIANALEDLGLQVTNVSNAQNKEVAETIIYDFTDGQKLESLQQIQSKLDGSKIAINIPNEILEEHNNTQIITVNNTPIETKSQADFLIILGTNTYE